MDSQLEDSQLPDSLLAWSQDGDSQINGPQLPDSLTGALTDWQARGGRIHPPTEEELQQDMMTSVIDSAVLLEQEMAAAPVEEQRAHDEAAAEAQEQQDREYQEYHDCQEDESEYHRDYDGSPPRRAFDHEAAFQAWMARRTAGDSSLTGSSHSPIWQPTSPIPWTESWPPTGSPVSTAVDSDVEVEHQPLERVTRTATPELQPTAGSPRAGTAAPCEEGALPQAASIQEGRGHEPVGGI